MRYTVSVEVTKEYFIIHWPWGKDIRYTSPGLGNGFLYSHDRLSEWAKKRERNDFFKPGWDW